MGALLEVISGDGPEKWIPVAEGAVWHGHGFLITCGQGVCRLIRNAQEKIALNQAPVDDALVSTGDRIDTKDASFLVYALRDELCALPSFSENVLLRLFLLLWSQPYPLFAIVDAARDAAALPLLLGNVDQIQSLYEGPEADDLAEAAPYLVQLSPSLELLGQLLENGWGESWCTYLTSGDDFAAVRRQLRRYLLVEIDGRTHYFRFYDPRVLRDFLPTCSAEELERFFGPIHSFLVESEDATSVIRFQREATGLQSRAMPLRVAGEHQVPPCSA